MDTRQPDTVIIYAQQIKVEHCISATPRSNRDVELVSVLSLFSWPVKETAIHVKKSLLHKYSLLKFSDLEVWCWSQDFISDWQFAIYL